MREKKTPGKQGFRQLVGGMIRVVIVKEEHDWIPFFSTDPKASVAEIVEAFADRATIEQDFHDVKEVWGAGQQQCGTSGPTWPSSISICGCIRWWNSGLGTAVTKNSAIAAPPHGTISNAALLTRIVAKPYGDTSYKPNYQRLAPFGRYREKSLGLLDAS